jgi:hypothetical protein
MKVRHVIFAVQYNLYFYYNFGYMDVFAAAAVEKDAAQSLSQPPVKNTMAETSNSNKHTLQINTL